MRPRAAIGHPHCLKITATTTVSRRIRRRSTTGAVAIRLQLFLPRSIPSTPIVISRFFPST